MASGKRQPSKQKRTTQNRQQKAALQARKAAAVTPASSRSAGRSGSGGGMLGRLRGAFTPAPRAQAAAGDGGAAAPRRSAPTSRGDQPIGYRAALIAVIGAVAAILLCCVQSTPVNAEGDLYTSEKLVAEWSVSALRAGQVAPDATPDEVATAVEEWSPGRSSEKLVQALWPTSLFMLLPALAAFLAFRAVQRRASSKVVNRAMYGTLLGALLTFNLFIFFLPTVIAVTVAGFQVRRAEASAAAAAAADAADGADDHGDVIDAEVVEDDEDDVST